MALTRQEAVDALAGMLDDEADEMEVTEEIETADEF